MIVILRLLPRLSIQERCTRSMRYPKNHKDASRRRLIEMGGCYAKRHGFNMSGMASLAASAGMTTGALYKHFANKSDLFAVLIASELERSARRYDRSTRVDDDDLHKMLASYLSLEHVRDPERGCPLPSLTPEIARAGPAAKRAYRAGLLTIHGKLRRFTASPEDAWSLLAQNVGAVMLARAVPDKVLQRAIVSAIGRSSAQLVARQGGESPLPPGRGRTPSNSMGLPKQKLVLSKAR